jgi:hypothetical protein
MGSLYSTDISKYQYLVGTTFNLSAIKIPRFMVNYIDSTDNITIKGLARLREYPMITVDVSTSKIISVTMSNNCLFVHRRLWCCTI